MANVGEMETFVDKVISSGGSHFDPMLEEKGGWIYGEALKHNEDMVDAIIEVMTETSQGSLKGALNPFRARIGEILLSNFEKNFSDFLVSKDAVNFKVDSHIALLKNEVVITKFLGPKPNPQALETWLQTLKQQLKGTPAASVGMWVKRTSFYPTRRVMLFKLLSCYPRLSPSGVHACSKTKFQDFTMRTLAIQQSSTPRMGVT